MLDTGGPALGKMGKVKRSYVTSMLTDIQGELRRITQGDPQEVAHEVQGLQDRIEQRKFAETCYS